MKLEIKQGLIFVATLVISIVGISAVFWELGDVKIFTSFIVKFIGICLIVLGTYLFNKHFAKIDEDIFE
jgi:hypothetical protein